MLSGRNLLLMSSPIISWILVPTVSISPGQGANVQVPSSTFRVERVIDVEEQHWPRIFGGHDGIQRSISGCPSTLELWKSA